MMTFIFLLVCISVSAWKADALATSNTQHSAETAAMCEWLTTNKRFKTTAVELFSPSEPEEQPVRIVVSTTREVTKGEVLFRLSRSSVWSATDAYQDRDLGPKFRDVAAKAGPGFGVVALAGGLAAERVRRYRSIEGQGTAPESIGTSIPSNWGAFARWLWWSKQQDGKGSNIDESLMDTVLTGVNLVVPLLDVTARRAWSSAAADKSKPSAPFLSEEWAREAMFNDGSAMSWSRGELESVALGAFGLVLEQQKSPPPFFLSGVGSLIPTPFLEPSGQAPETWPGGESLALIPIVEELFLNDDEGSKNTNAVLGSPTKDQCRGEDDCLWCVATRDLKAGERVVAFDPWEDE